MIQVGEEKNWGMKMREMILFGSFNRVTESQQVGQAGCLPVSGLEGM